MLGYYLLAGILFLVGMAVSGRLKSKFKEYSEIPLREGLSGKEVAERMLRENGIYDVKVTSAQGFLSDHYNPADKTVNLSPDATPLPLQLPLTNVATPCSMQPPTACCRCAVSWCR